jgi:small subunit ribosomal protein S20
MATHKSALKEHRASLKRREVNRTTRSILRTEIKKIRELAASGDAAAAAKLLPHTYAKLDRSVKKGVLKENAGNRYKSRLSRLVNTTRARAAKA